MMIMTKFIVKYQFPNENNVKSLEVYGYNVFHAEKLAKETLGKHVYITSVTSVNSERR